MSNASTLKPVLPAQGRPTKQKRPLFFQDRTIKPVSIEKAEADYRASLASEHQKTASASLREATFKTQVHPSTKLTMQEWSASKKRKLDGYSAPSTSAPRIKSGVQKHVAARNQKVVKKQPPPRHPPPSKKRRIFGGISAKEGGEVRRSLDYGSLGRCVRLR